MDTIKQKREPKSDVVVKAGIWYTICNFLFRGMAFITTPIFARMLTKSELGDFSNFSSWVTILTVVTAFDLQTSIIRSKLEHEDDIDSYIWSILSFTTIATFIVYIIVLIFPTFFTDFFATDMKYIHVMFAYLFTAPAYQMLITKQRAFYQYKTFVALTGIAIISATLLSLVMVLLMEDKYAGRVLGYYIPNIILGMIIYIFLAYKGKRIKIEYWKYACVICLPLVPHVLSMYLLGTSGKIIITRICGSEYTAIYSIAYSCYHIVTILFDSMNKAWAPWLLESLHYNRYKEIMKNSKMYILIFLFFVVGTLMFVPEIILILGGRQYESANYCLPPLITGCMFQFIYTMYVNIEFYKKKTLGVAGATMFATTLNIILNLVLIPLNPKNGHVIAAYTTLVGYMVLFICHYLLVKKMGMGKIYDFKFIIIVLISVCVISGLMNILYSMQVLRYIFILIYGCIGIVIFIKKKDRVLEFLRKK